MLVLLPNQKREETGPLMEELKAALVNANIVGTLLRL